MKLIHRAGLLQLSVLVITSYRQLAQMKIFSGNSIYGVEDCGDLRHITDTIVSKYRTFQELSTWFMLGCAFGVVWCLLVLPILFRDTHLALGQLCNCPSANEPTMEDVGICISTLHFSIATQKDTGKYCHVIPQRTVSHEQYIIRRLLT